MSGSSNFYVNAVFDGEFAQAAWKGYLSNRTGFGTDQLPKAERIEAVHRVLLRAPNGFSALELVAAFTDKNVVGFAKTAVSALVLGPAANNVRNILYVHTRTRQFGAGHATHLIRKAQAMALQPSEPKTLSTTAAACNGWYASLLFLRNGFTCDIALFKTDITLPGEVTKGGSSALSFRYPPSRGEDQVELVKKAMEAQRARKTKRSQEFAAELQKVYEYIAGKTNDQFMAEIASASAFTDNMATRFGPTSSASRKASKRKRDEASSSLPQAYVPPVRRSASKQPAVAAPSPYASKSLLRSGSKSGRSDQWTNRHLDEVETTIARILDDYDDDEDDSD